MKWQGKKSVESYVKEQNINSLFSFKHVSLVSICLSFPRKIRIQKWMFYETGLFSAC